MRVLSPTVFLTTTLVAAGCGLLDEMLEGPAPTEVLLYPDVLAVALRPAEERSYDVVVTISSSYDSPERFADGWRVLAPDGSVLGEHTLLHDHGTERPFTRTQGGLHIPEGIGEVTVEGRERRSGFGGASVTVDVPA